MRRSSMAALSTLTSLLVGMTACSPASAPQFEHDGPLVMLRSEPFELVGFRSGDRGCIGWRKKHHRFSQCSSLLAPKQLSMTDDFARRFQQLTGRTGLAVRHVTFVMKSGPLTVETVPGDREAFFVADPPSEPVDQIVLLDEDDQEIARIECRNRVGFPSLEVCVQRAFSQLPPG